MLPRPAADCASCCRMLLGCVPADADFSPRVRIARHHGTAAGSIGAAVSELPQRRQNRRAGSLPTPHRPQSNSSGCGVSIRTVGAGVGAGAGLGAGAGAAGRTASGWTSAAGAATWGLCASGFAAAGCAAAVAAEAGVDAGVGSAFHHDGGGGLSGGGGGIGATAHGGGEGRSGSAEDGGSRASGRARSTLSPVRCRNPPQEPQETTPSEFPAPHFVQMITVHSPRLGSRISPRCGRCGGLAASSSTSSRASGQSAGAASQIFAWREGYRTAQRAAPSGDVGSARQRASRRVSGSAECRPCARPPDCVAPCACECAGSPAPGTPRGRRCVDGRPACGWRLGPQR